MDDPPDETVKCVYLTIPPEKCGVLLQSGRRSSANQTNLSMNLLVPKPNHTERTHFSSASRRNTVVVSDPRNNLSSVRGGILHFTHCCSTQCQAGVRLQSENFARSEWVKPSKTKMPMRIHH
jgi:hypothetical protein